MSLIVTVTPNPSHDRTVTLEGPLQRGAVIRTSSVTSQAGGKGVNISRAAQAAGLATVAVLPAAEHDPYVAELVEAGIDCRPVPSDRPVRMNITVTEPDGTTTKLNSSGETLSPSSLAGLEEAARSLAATASWVALAGSLPPGAPTDWYAHAVARLRGSGAKVAVDTSDAPLRALVDALATAAPDLLKPNGEELASVTGADPLALEHDPSAAAKAARTLVDQGVGTVLVTLGGRGAVLVDADGAWYAAAPVVEVVSTVGAGDSSLFGYLLGDIEGLAAPQRLALAVAYGSAAAGLPGTTIPRRDQVEPDRVVTERVHL